MSAALQLSVTRANAVMVMVGTTPASVLVSTLRISHNGISFYYWRIPACASLTFENCNMCTDDPGSNSNDTAECLFCQDNYALKDNLTKGEEAVCVGACLTVVCSSLTRFT